MKRTKTAKTTTKPKTTSKVAGKAKRHQYADVFLDTAPLLMALSVLDTRPSKDEGEEGEDIGTSIWQGIAEQQLGFLSDADRKVCFDRAEMVLGLFLATGSIGCG